MPLSHLSITQACSAPSHSCALPLDADGHRSAISGAWVLIPGKCSTGCWIQENWGMHFCAFLNWSQMPFPSVVSRKTSILNSCSNSCFDLTQGSPPALLLFFKEKASCFPLCRDITAAVALPDETEGSGGETATTTMASLPLHAWSHGSRGHVWNAGHHEMLPWRDAALSHRPRSQRGTCFC